MADDVEKAILFAFDQSGAVAPELRERAVGYLRDVQATPDAWRACVDRYQCTSYPEVKFWCLQTLAHAFLVPNLLAELPETDVAVLHRTMMGFVGDAVANTSGSEPGGVPPFLKNKLSQCVALVAKIHFPDRWPGFLRDFLGLLSTGNLSNAADMFCRVLDAVDETCVCGAFGDAFDQRCAARVKDAMRNDAVALTQLVDAFATLIACPDLKIATAATSTAMRYVDWMDVSLFTSVRTQSNPPQSQSIADAARVALTSPNPDRRAAGCAFFTSLVAKGMDHSQKIELITGLRLVDVCAHLHAVSVGDEDEDAAVCAAQLTAAVGHELLSCLRAGDAAAGADQTEPHAASPPTHTLTQAALLTDTLMPTGVAHLRNDDERVVAAALPLCAAYVHRLKADRGSSGRTIEGKKRDNGVVQVSRDTGGFGFGDGGVLGFGGVLGGGDSQSPTQSHSRNVGPVCVNPETARGALGAIASACVARGAFPDERRAGVDFSRGDCHRVKEAEAETAEVRRELGVLFRAVARCAPPIALHAVRSALIAALPLGSDGQSASQQKPTWQQVESAVAAVHSLGEGANDPAVKPGCEGFLTDASVAGNGLTHTDQLNASSPLGELFEFVVSRWNGEIFGETNSSLQQCALHPQSNPSASHRLVAPVFLETCVRYHLAVARNPGQLLLPVLAAFLDQRGARHPDPEVAARACYLFSKFVKPLRPQIAAYLPEVLSAMEGVVLSCVEPLQVEMTRVNGNTQSLNKGTGGAMATVGNDDRLYLYEALGYLLGTEDDAIPARTQIELTETYCTRLRHRLSLAAAQNDSQTAARCIVGMANIAKGFSVRLAAETRPEIGVALCVGLEMATSSLSHFDTQNDGASVLIRQRVVAYFQRMVQGVGERAFPFAVPLVHKIAQSGTKKDLKECFVLCNQLAATFKDKLGVFITQVSPLLVEQTMNALAPFVSPDGRTHGVLGLVRRIGDVANFLSAADAAIATDQMTPEKEAEFNALKNTEDSREARELEVAFVAHVHALGSNQLVFALQGGDLPPVREGVQNLMTTITATRETVLASLAAAAAAHPSAVSRKAAVQALTKLALHWFPMAPNNQTNEPVPGFSQFAVEVVVNECCVAAVLRGDLDVRDAAGAAAVGETVAFQRLALERLGPFFATQLRDEVLVKRFGLDHSLANEYIAAVASTAQTAHRDARAVIGRCQQVVGGARPALRKRPCKR